MRGKGLVHCITDLCSRLCAEAPARLEQIPAGCSVAQLLLQLVLCCMHKVSIALLCRLAIGFTG